MVSGVFSLVGPGALVLPMSLRASNSVEWISKQIDQIRATPTEVVDDDDLPQVSADTLFAHVGGESLDSRASCVP
jgi:hypothetical protein